jgi:hypothetical protein
MRPTKVARWLSIVAVAGVGVALTPAAGERATGFLETGVVGRDFSALGIGGFDLQAPRTQPAQVVVNSAGPRCLPQTGVQADRYIQQPAGCYEDEVFKYGPYTINPGSDLSRPYLEIPLSHSFATYVHPSLMTLQGAKPNHETIHIHHAHWFEIDTTPSAENYDAGFGPYMKWIFGTGQEETAADVEQRTAAEQQYNGATFKYGEFIDGSKPQFLIYMIHNESSMAQTVWMTLHVHVTYGTAAQIKAATGTTFRNLTGLLTGATFDVPRNFANPSSVFDFPKDEPNAGIRSEGLNWTTWTSDTDGVIVGIGGHMHMGGLYDEIENLGGSPSAGGTPCVGNSIDGGTILVRSESIMRDQSGTVTGDGPLDPTLAQAVPSSSSARFPSEDFQMGVTSAYWRAPIHKGDRIRVNGIYENGANAWYYAMNHFGMYIDKEQPTTAPGNCAPYLLNNPSATQDAMVTGVPNRPWDAEQKWCGTGSPYSASCGFPASTSARGIQSDVVQIIGFVYYPGDRTLSGALGAPAVFKLGHIITLVNDDQALGSVRHTFTTCRWPCDGGDYANYPQPDGVYDSNTLGRDWVDGGTEQPVARLDTTKLGVGTYSYFCRIHPWMEGAFVIVP